MSFVVRGRRSREQQQTNTAVFSVEKKHEHADPSQIVVEIDDVCVRSVYHIDYYWCRIVLCGLDAHFMRIQEDHPGESSLD